MYRSYFPLLGQASGHFALVIVCVFLFTLATNTYSQKFNSHAIQDYEISPFSYDGHHSQVTSPVSYFDSVFNIAGGSPRFAYQKTVTKLTSGTSFSTLLEISNSIDSASRTEYHYALTGYTYMKVLKKYNQQQCAYEIFETEEVHYNPATMAPDSIIQYGIRRVVFEYDLQNKLMKKTEYQFSSNEWVATFRHSYSYLSDGSPSVILTEQYLLSTWRNYAKSEYNYNSSNQLTDITRYRFQLNQWRYTSKNEYSYQGTSVLPATLITMNYENTTWVHKLKYDYIYLSSGDLRQYNLYEWATTWNHKNTVLLSHVTAPHLGIAQPGEGGILWGGKNAEISWYGDDETNMHVEFSSDNGFSWSTIYTGWMLYTSVIQWQIPQINTTLGKLRISEVGTGVSFTTPGNFSISTYEIGDGDAYYFDAGRFTMTFNKTGVLAQPLVNGISGGLFEDISLLFSGGLLLSGKRNGELFANGNIASALITDYQAGKMGEPASALTNKIYVVRKSDPAFGRSWQNWVFAVQRGADFYDGNGDGLYTPVDLNNNGMWDAGEDKPAMQGAMVAFSCSNDGVPASLRRFPGMEPLGIEINQTLFGYDLNSQNPLDANTIFVKYTLTNSGAFSPVLDSVLFSVYLDPDIEDYEDDLTGTDTTIRTIFAYNDGDDPNIAGIVPPAFGVALLQGPAAYIPGETFIDNNGNSVFDSGIDTPLTFSLQLNGNGVMDTLHGARNQSMVSTSQMISSHPTQRVPATAQEARYLQLGTNTSGDLIDPCSWAFGSVSGSVPCASVNPRMIYSGDPVVSYGWINTVPHDQKSMSTYGPFQLVTGKPVDIILAYTANRGTSSLNSVTEMKKSIERAFLLYSTGFPTITDVQYHTQPSEYVLYQNYPNPFNPETNIRFELPEASRVKLAVYNVLGEEVATIMNQHLTAGTHHTSFNAGKLATGIYFYSLTTGAQQLVKKMIVIK